MTANQQELIRQAKNQYAREWRAKNKDRVKANNDRYWARKAEQLAKEPGEKNEADIAAARSEV